VTIVHRELIIASAARHRLPAVYPLRSFASAGGLIAFGADAADLYRRAAGYVDRILKGEKPRLQASGGLGFESAEFPFPVRPHMLV
jgi:putative ABC transport system substrate-binding protein